MKKGLARRFLVYTLCFSFLSWMSGLSAIAAETRGLPIGEMVSKGDVKHEIAAGKWERVQPSYFLVFSGTKVRTDDGVATVRLSNNSQLGIHSGSLLSFDQTDQSTLLRGSAEFYIPSGLDMKILAGKVSIMKPRTLQAGGTPSPQRDEDTFGTISIQPNGSVTVKNIQGKVAILDQSNAVLTELSPNKSITITPTPGGKAQVAQATETAAGGAGAAEGATFMGLGTWTWVGIGAAAVATGIGIGVASSGGGGGGSEVCP